MSLSNPTNPPLVNEHVATRVSTGLVFAVDENQTKVNQLRGNSTAGSTGAGIPKQVFGVTASVTPSSSGITSVVTVTFQNDPSDRTFTGVVVFIKGYQGNKNPVQIANSATSPVQFTLNNTGENLSLSVQAIGNAGRAPIAQVPITSVKLPFSALGGAGNVTQTSAKNLDLLPNGVTYARTLGTALTSGAVDPSKSGVLMKGSVVPSLSAGFSYTSTTTTITWSWYANQVVYRADGTKTIIGAGTQTITGLVANNTYYFYPYYDETSGTLKFLQASDITIPTITGVLLNGTTQWIQTTTGSLHADGGTGQYSLECWVKTTSATNQGLMGFSNPQGSGAVVGIQVQLVVNNVGEVVFSYANTTPAVKSVTTSGAGVADGAWHHIVVTFATGGTVTIYVDGVSKGTGSALGAQGTAGATDFWHIGFAHGTAGWTIGVSTFFNGSISHAAVYNGVVLTASQVAAHCQSFVNLGSATYDTAVSNDVPSYYWKLIEPSGTNAADSAGTNTGTYQNAPTLNQSTAIISVLGTPAIAWPFTSFLASQGQNAQSRISLSSGSMSALTPASGSGSGSGGGSGGGGAKGGCFSGNTQVKTQRGDVPIQHVQAGDLVLTAAGTWREVTAVIEHEASERPMLNMGGGELTTLKQTMLVDGKWKPAEEVIFDVGTFFTESVFILSVDATSDDEHSFTLANGRIAHNVLK